MDSHNTPKTFIAPHVPAMVGELFEYNTYLKGTTHIGTFASKLGLHAASGTCPSRVKSP